VEVKALASPLGATPRPYSVVHAPDEDSLENSRVKATNRLIRSHHALSGQIWGAIDNH
jgi:hypothetical protein